MKSVGTTALVWTAAVLLLVGLAGTVVAYVAGRHESNFVFDGLLVQMAANVQPEAQADAPRPSYGDPEDAVVVQVWDAEGRAIRGAESRIPRQAQTGFSDLVIDGEPWRTFVVHADGRTVQVSQRQAVRDEVAEQLAMSAVLPILAALPIVWAFVAFALQRLFRQLDRTSQAVASRSVDAVEPVPSAGVPVEMKSFLDAMNRLLGRQSAAIEQQRRFVSDAAHELRTPLTALQILADTLSERAARGQGAADAELAQELTHAVDRARTLVNQLLKLAEVDALREGSDVAPVDLRETLLEVIAGLVPAASLKRIEFVVNAEATATVSASAVDLATLLSILADNAVRYSPTDTTIEADLLVMDAATTIQIRDRGIGIAPESLPRIYDRFFRAAPQHVEGSGLGLSIAKAVADRYGFALEITNRPQGGVIATVAFPTSA